MLRKIDVSGQRFGRLIASREVAPLRKYNYRWLCLCDCGNTKEADYRHLRAGSITSCGCLKRELTGARFTTHGASKIDNRYSVWCGMRRRCLDPTDSGYPSYGGRGITICPEWSDFARFAADMGPRPFGTSIERINNDGPYSPDNCKWSDRITQANNRRSSRYIEHDGLRLTVAEWSRKTGIGSTTIRQRIDTYGWPPTRALVEP